MELAVQPGKKKAYARINEALKTIDTDFSNRDPIDCLGEHCKSSKYKCCRPMNILGDIARVVTSRFVD